MKAYEKYKNSGISWLGKIPEHWKTIKFKRMHNGSNVGEAIGKNFWSDDTNDSVFYTAQILPIRTNYNGFPKWKYTQHNDLLLARNGTPYVYLPVEGAIYTDHIIRVSIIDRFNRKFVRYCLQNSIKTEKAEGVIIPTWSVYIWDKQILPLPPLAEQEAIVKLLNYEVSRIGKLILIRKRQIVNLNELKKAVINKVVTKGDWKRVRLKRLFKIFSGATPKSDNPHYWDGNIIWITPADFQTEDKYIYHGTKNITEAGFNACSTSLVPSGSIIFSKRAPVGKVAINKIALCTNQGCLSCVPLENVSSEFFYYVISILQEEFEKEAGGTTFKEISLTAFANFLLPVPPIAEQNETAKYLDKKCGQIDKLITIREKQITELNELKARLISDAVTGKIDVR